jgi:hypothetical protein
MICYGLTGSEQAARSFLQLVQDHLYWEEAVVDESATDRVAIRRRPMPRLDLFSRRGPFIEAMSASDEGKLVGLYLLSDQGGHAHIDVGYVVSKYRRHGIGYELLVRSYNYLTGRGRREVYIDIRTVEMVRLVVRLGEVVPKGTLIAHVSLDPHARDLKDDLYE